MLRSALRVLCLLVTIGVVFFGAPRRARAAGPQEQQLAQALFDEGRRLMDQGRFSEACPKLAESQRLDPGGGTLLNLAICHEKEGKVATAKVDFEEALAVANRDGRANRQQIAREHAAAIDASIPRITVVVPAASETEGLEVKLDGLALRRAAWGVPLAVDPGAHVIDAAAPGRTAWTSNVSLDRAQKKSVEIPTLARGLAALPPPAAPPDLGSARIVPRPFYVGPLADESPPPVVNHAPRHANPVFYAALTAALVAAGTSAVTGGLALGAKSDAKAAGCVPDRHYCPNQDGYDTADRATTLAWVSTVALGVAVVSTVVLLVVPSKVLSKAPAAGATAGGLPFGLSGTF